VLSSLSDLHAVQNDGGQGYRLGHIQQKMTEMARMLTSAQHDSSMQPQILGN
jgi:hypothetical protein